jgi:hypothetical protein
LRTNNYTVRATFLFLLAFICTLSFAQTRRIAHRAHSGAKQERYDGRDGNYGDPYIPQMVQVHLESGRDTLVEFWDSLANPEYLRQVDTTPRAIIYPRDKRPKQDIREMGAITHRLIVKA